MPRLARDGPRTPASRCDMVRAGERKLEQWLTHTSGCPRRDPGMGYGMGLEAQRTEKSKAFYTQKKEEAKLKARAEAEADLSAVTDILVATGYYIEPTPVGAMKALKAEFASSQEEAPAAADAADE